eukprot:TRINITY_DN22826_c0_g1_i1.p1 TRINITY_DN22826_c0_g1~~TRINITY_DN22826_c0_g1_i1.p1  ORF type:complete len:391 (-),score=-3.15 TRINITY_DN22826_c0_g1_i1:532-1704(-)
MVNYPFKQPNLEEGTVCMLGARTHSSCTLHLPTGTPPRPPVPRPTNQHAPEHPRQPDQQNPQQGEQQLEGGNQWEMATWPVIRSGFGTDKGGREYMEDAHVAVDDLSQAIGDVAVAHPRAFYGIFDGHGGDAAARFARQSLMPHVLRDASFPLHAGAALRSAFLQTDTEMRTARTAEGHALESGTTALAALLLGRSLFVANAGDCRAVLCRGGRAVDLSRDHRPACPRERARVERAGGFVVDDYLNDQLAVTRALGDWHLEGLKTSREDSSGAAAVEEGPLIAEPEVNEAQLTEADEFLVIACDGLWDAFKDDSSRGVVAYARRRLRLHNDPQLCSEELVEEAIRRNACDNVTVGVVCFSPNPPPTLQHQALLHSQLHKSFSEYSLRCVH